jgi:1-acyl-sn-glycerol-3-phosphate acyltransferase
MPNATSAETVAGREESRRPSNVLYDAVGLGMLVYCRAAFHVEILGFRQVPWRAGPLLVSTHRSESDVPLVCSSLCTNSGLWRERRHKTHFAARDDLFEPGFFAAFPRRLPRAARRALYPLCIAPGLPLVRVHPVSSANGLRLGPALRQLPADTPLAPILPDDAMDALRARAGALHMAPPATAADALRGDFADILWRPCTSRDLADPAFAPVWRQQTRRATGDFRRLVELLRARQPILLFPEGRPSPDGAIGPLEGGLAALVRRGRPEMLLPIGMAYDPLTTGRTRALIALGRAFGPPSEDVDGAVLSALRAVTPLTCGQVLAARLVEAASAGEVRIPGAKLLHLLDEAIRASRDQGRRVDPALDAGRAPSRLQDALRALARSGLVSNDGGAVAIAPERILASVLLGRLAREWASVQPGG